jgi:hypothetical protein
MPRAPARPGGRSLNFRQWASRSGKNTWVQSMSSSGRRCRKSGNSGPEAILFDRPQNVRARTARGSDLLHERTLRQLLTWPKATQQPNLAVVVVDADGDNQKASRLRQTAESISGQPTIIAVAVQEFEAWLLADPAALASALGTSVQPIVSPEALAPRAAKQQLMTLLAARGTEGRLLRHELARTLQLVQLRNRCPSFNDFLRDLRAARPH